MVLKATGETSSPLVAGATAKKISSYDLGKLGPAIQLKQLQLLMLQW